MYHVQYGRKSFLLPCAGVCTFYLGEKGRKEQRDEGKKTKISMQSERQRDRGSEGRLIVKGLRVRRMPEKA